MTKKALIFNILGLKKFDETPGLTVIFPNFINIAAYSWIPNIMSASDQIWHVASGSIRHITPRPKKAYP
jgi:hypothetical protein